MTDAIDVVGWVLTVVVLLGLAVIAAFGAGALLAVAVAGFQWTLDTLGVVL